MDKDFPIAGTSILLVEDEAFIAMAISDELEGAGAACVEHSFMVAEAKEVIDIIDYEVAILDLRLAEGTSKPLARILTERNTPIIFHSGHAEVDDLKNEFPKARICHKPCHLGEFVEVIATMLGD